MPDIELVIKIPEEIRLALINNIQLSLDQQSFMDSYIKHAIINGVKLPKGEMVNGTKIKWSKGPEEWYCSYGKCYNCNTEFMCSKAHYCPGCGEKIEEEEVSSYNIKEASTIIEADTESEDEG